MIKRYCLIYSIFLFIFNWIGAFATVSCASGREIPWEKPLGRDGRVFSVGDAVEFIYLTEPLDYDAAEPLLSRTPRGDAFYYATRQNNIKENTTRSILWIIWKSDIEDYLEGKSKETPNSIPLVNWKSRGDGKNFGLMSRSGIMRQFQWGLAENFVYFIGKEDNKPDQVYRVNVKTRALEQITYGPFPVVHYQYDEATKRLFFYRLVPSEIKQGRQAAELVGTKDIGTVRSGDYEELRLYKAEPQLCVQEMEGRPQVVVLPFPNGARAQRYMSRVWPSPDGKYVAVSLAPPAGKRWDGRYARPENPEIEAFPAARQYGARYLGNLERAYQQFYLLNMSTGRWDPIFDAPAAGAVGAAWSKDGKRIVFGPTFLPIEPGDKADEARRTWQYIVEYNVANRSYRPVYVLAGDMVKDLAGKRHVRADIRSADEVEILLYDGAEMKSVSLLRSDHGWSRAVNKRPSPTYKFDLFVSQSLNVPPKIAVRESRSGKERVLVELNPELRNVKYGRAEYIEWPDERANVWRGVLVYPVAYRSGQRYPLVIQIRGVIPDEFLVGGHGGSTAPFAARPLASTGMFVLQMSPRPIVDRGEGKMETMLEDANRGVESAIDYLEKKGLIDAERVGLTGWSLTGLPVLNTVTFSKRKIAASVIADAYGPGMYMYASEFGFDAPGMHYMETLYRNAYPWGEGLARWVANNPVFHLDKVRGPILLQSYLLETETQWWEVYAILRRLGKSVEMWKYPGAEHIPRRPDQQFHAQDIVVDWYRFWLKGEKDSSQRKAERYARWEEERRIQSRDLQLVHNSRPK